MARRGECGARVKDLVVAERRWPRVGPAECVSYRTETVKNPADPQEDSRCDAGIMQNQSGVQTPTQPSSK